MCGKPPVRALIVMLAILGATLPSLSLAVDAPPLRSDKNAPPPNIVIGFVGGFVGHNNQHHGPVRLAQRIRPEFAKDDLPPA